ncbi:cellulose binding domain-containing protein [Actinomadura algeriensis]|uniref:CBM2 domain-containing protein n=1 Tax=Actinomadura algeriensis TaxID=1679523 RepID=A0ABR9JW16_9ACTN|nr:cellulose binding domain-containing protein [Actinomadura algeriensis]MBE1534673.1 hypothetical protein [Actinomadura algeriensis]
MSGDERRYVPPDHRTTTDFAAPAPAPAPDPDATDPNATDPDDPNATDPDPPGAAPDEPVRDVPEPDERAPDEPARRAKPSPQDVRVAPLNVPPAGPGRAGGTAELAGPDVSTAPPTAPPAPPPARAPAARARGAAFRGPLFALGVGVLVVAVALVAMFALGGGEGGEESPAPAVSLREEPPPTAAGGAGSGPADVPSTEPRTAGTPSAGTPTGSGTPPAAPGRMQGDGVTYEVVQRDSGYYEGSFTLTNRTGAPMTSWRLTFRAPGADVGSAWGGRLVQGGERVVIENSPGAAAVPPGGTVTVTFGAAGTPAPPAECVLNGAGCGL